MALAALPQASGAAETDSVQSIAFASLEVQHRSVFSSLGGKLSFPLEPARFVLMATAGTSLTDVARVSNGRKRTSEVEAEGRLFLGFEQGFGQIFAGVTAGPSLARFVGRNGRTRTHAGAALHVDLWYRPADNQYLAWTTILDSARRSLWSRVRYGYRFGALPFFAGPEASFQTGIRTRKARLGVHVSEWKLGPAVLSIAAGAQWEKRAAAYMSLAAYVNF